MLPYIYQFRIQNCFNNILYKLCDAFSESEYKKINKTQDKY